MEPFHLSITDKITLLKLVKNSLADIFNRKVYFPIDPSNFSLSLKSKCGAFVSYYNQKKLRACMGQFNTKEPLHDVIKQIARSAALNDSRFKPISTDEINDLEIEISVLSPLEAIDSIDQIVLGTHGIYIKKDNRAGTFLPQVAAKTKWTKEEFLGHCSRDKARIGWSGWRKADLYRYEAIIIREKDFQLA